MTVSSKFKGRAFEYQITLKRSVTACAAADFSRHFDTKGISELKLQPNLCKH